MINSRDIEVWQRLMLPPARLNIHQVCLRRLSDACTLPTSKDEIASHLTNGKECQVLLTRERGYIRFDQLLASGEVGILVHHNRAALLEGVKLILHNDRLGKFKVQALVIKSVCFPRPLVE